MDVGRSFNNSRMGRAVALIALTAAFARALIPVGFMPASVHGTVQIMFCDGGGHHHADGASPGHEPAGHHAADQGPCPFALSGAAPLLPAAVPGEALAATLDQFAVALPAAATREAPPRYAAPRGPPTLA